MAFLGRFSQHRRAFTEYTMAGVDLLCVAACVHGLSERECDGLNEVWGHFISLKMGIECVCMCACTAEVFWGHLGFYFYRTWNNVQEEWDKVP